jgi:hypothetical protein
MNRAFTAFGKSAPPQRNQPAVMATTFGAGNGERTMQRDLALGYAGKSKGGRRTRRYTRPVPRSEPDRRAASPRATQVPSPATPLPMMRAPETIDKQPDIDSPSSTTNVSVLVTPARDVEYLKLYDHLGDTTSVGSASGRLRLFYPMFRSADGRVFMEHRIVNPRTGELTSKYALIQEATGDPLVEDFELC